jgi:hypothetical protein
VAAQNSFTAFIKAATYQPKEIPMPGCPVCLRGTGKIIDERERVPVLQNIIVESRQEASIFPMAKLSMAFCETCGFLWNKEFDPKKMDYGKGYNNSVQASKAYLAHQNLMTEKVLANSGAINYLEIGCGAGEFIEALDRTGRLTTAIGFDPVWSGQRSFGSHVTIWPDYFNSNTARKLPSNINVVCSRHTIEHIPKPRDFIRDISEFISRRRVKLFLETPDATWILRNVAFEDLFYEHCSLFTPQSMQYLLAEFGLVSTVTPVFGGQYMWIEAEAGIAPAIVEVEVEDDLVDGYVAKSHDALIHWRRIVQSMRRMGPVALWGAASKGVTFALLVEGIDCAIDLNSTKQGCFMPVSAIPIVSPWEAMDRGVGSIIIMNPNYEAEIHRTVEEMGWKADVFSLRANTLQ